LWEDVVVLTLYALVVIIVAGRMFKKRLD